MSAGLWFFLGCMFMRLLVSLPWLQRPCCRRHFETDPEHLAALKQENKA